MDPEGVPVTLVVRAWVVLAHQVVPWGALVVLAAKTRGLLVLWAMMRWASTRIRVAAVMGWVQP